MGRFSVGQVLTASELNTIMTANPGGRAHANLSGTVGTSGTAISMTQDWVRGGMTFATATFTIPEAGEYDINAMVALTAGATSNANQLVIKQNGTVILSDYATNVPSGNAFTLKINDTYTLALNDAITMAIVWSSNSPSWVNTTGVTGQWSATMSLFLASQ